MNKGAQSGKPLHTNVVQKTFDSQNQRAGEPKDEQLRISYGVIAEVNEDNSTVRIDIFDRSGKKTRVGSDNDKRQGGAFLPVIQSLMTINNLFGALRKGLIVRLYWRGKHFPGAESLVEIISDNTALEFTSGRKKPRSNELATQPWEIFMGGTE